MEIEYFKLMYVFNYPKLLNFKYIYKKIINPYHYSGIIELFNYCHYNGLIIQNVTSTLNPCQVQFVNLNAERIERKAISELLTSLKRFYKSGTIKETYPAYNNFTRFEIED